MPIESGILADVLDQMDQGLLAADKSLEIVYYNRGFLEMSGLTDEFMNKHRSLNDIISGWVEMYGLDPLIVIEEQERARSREECTFELPGPEGSILEVRHKPLADGGLIRTFTDVTRQRRSEEKLRESELRYRTLIENYTNGAVFLFDHELRYLFAEGRGLAETGLDGEKLAGKTIYEALTREVAEFIEPFYRRTLEGERFVTEIPFAGRIFECHFIPLRDESGDVDRGMVMTQDVTARKQDMEAALKQSEESYRAMFHSNQAVKLLIDAETGSIEEVNDAACSFYGYARDELLDLNIDDINVLGSDNLIKSLANENAEEKRRLFFKHRKKDGQIRDVEIHTSRILHKNRTVLYAIIQDVTQRIEAEIALKESELRYRTLFNNACDAIVVHDMQGRILDANKLASERFGMSRDEITGKNLASFYLPEFDDKGSGIRKTLREQGSVNFETTQTLPDGGKLPIEVNAKVIPFQGRLAVISVSHDLSERKRNEAMMKSLTAKLISVQEEERKRIGRELHDQLCQNLTAIKVLLEGQIRRSPKGFDGRLSGSLKKTVAVLQESVAEVRRIIMNLRPTVLDDMGLTAAVFWLCNEIENLHPEMSVTACLTIRDEDCTEEIKTVLFRTVQECLNNAVKHSRGDKVEIEFMKLDNEIRLAVRDNGVGFSPDDLKYTGVGLHGMRERIEPLGGSLRIDSAPGRGTTILVYIPLSEKYALPSSRGEEIDSAADFRI